MTLGGEAEAVAETFHLLSGRRLERLPAHGPAPAGPPPGASPNALPEPIPPGLLEAADR